MPMNNAHFAQYVLSCEQVAEMLGCTQKTIEEKARMGLLPSIKFGRSHIFPVDALFGQLNELAKANLRPRTKSPTPANEKSFAPETDSAANDFVIVTGSKSISIGKARKAKAFEFGSTRKNKAA